VCPTKGAGNRHADMVEVSWTSAAVRIKGSESHPEQYLLTYWQLVKHVMKNWCDVLKLASTYHQAGCSVDNHPNAVQNSTAVIDSAANAGNVTLL